jgi:hypothetical protein
MIQGPGSTTSDSILARVSRGEHAFITNASRAKQLWPLLNQLNFGSDALVRQVLDALRTGLALKSAQIPSLNLGSAFIKPLPAPVGAYASGGPVTASSSSGLQPVSVHLHIDGRSEKASLLGERAEVARLERMMREANRGKVRR